MDAKEVVDEMPLLLRKRYCVAAPRSGHIRSGLSGFNVAVRGCASLRAALPGACVSTGGYRKHGRLGQGKRQCCLSGARLARSQVQAPKPPQAGSLWPAQRPCGLPSLSVMHAAV